MAYCCMQPGQDHPTLSGQDHPTWLPFWPFTCAICLADVPEGKGVSSSAAVEVATMAAIAAAYSMQLEGRELALLCQRVENAVVGRSPVFLRRLHVFHGWLCDGGCRWDAFWFWEAACCTWRLCDGGGNRGRG